MSKNISAAVFATTSIIPHSKNKIPIKKLQILKWTEFRVKLRNFLYYGLILVSYQKVCQDSLKSKLQIPFIFQRTEEYFHLLSFLSITPFQSILTLLQSTLVIDVGTGMALGARAPQNFAINKEVPYSIKNAPFFFRKSALEVSCPKV